ncbi:AbiH family protein, partial [Segatella copri]
MDKTINTTLIIGNGFDLSMGKHTSYKEFYEKLVKNKGFWDTSNPQPIGFRGNLLVKRQKFFYCTYSLGITE